MNNFYERTRLLVGDDAIKKLGDASVAIFGVGGVGGYVAEALARSGVGRIDLFDNDTISITNVNRQIIALNSTVGRYKTEVMLERILDINPNCKVTAYNLFYDPESAKEIDLSKYDYIADAIDTVKSKIELVKRAKTLGTPIISAMGAGNKLDPTAFEISDISKTTVCPLARVMRKELKAIGINHLKVCYSKEAPLSPLPSSEDSGKRVTPGSTAFCPSVMGLIMAGEIIKDIIKS
ncbi:MAG: tRNA threonylcarbamoyladenosine dehydratase [Clostridia bacterium]|nr:tRNA threonylcarbamoyladenosine dehydratase [Clostridia bacterium]